MPHSDAAAHAEKRFPHKTRRLVNSGLRAWTIAGLLRSLNLVFSRHNAKDLEARYHFTFTGSETMRSTITINRGTLDVADGHVGNPDLSVTADADTWLAFLRKERGILGALLTRKIRLKGNPKLLQAFGRCFPG